MSQKVVMPAGAPLFDHASQRNLHFSRDGVEVTHPLFRLRAAGTCESQPEDAIAPAPVTGPFGGGDADDAADHFHGEWNGEAGCKVEFAMIPVWINVLVEKFAREFADTW